MNDILTKLKGGDRRSIGRANEVARDVEQDPRLFKALFRSLDDDDPIVRMRSADAIEKVTQVQPQLLLGYTSKLLLLLETAQQQEICWHMAQIAPRVKYTPKEEKRVVTALKHYLTHKSKIVNVCAMEALATFAEQNPSILSEIIQTIKTQVKNGSPAVQSRGRKLLLRLNLEE